MKMLSIAMKLIAISIVANQRQQIHNNLVISDVCFQTYDYIVVGGGTAGCVVAARLAEDTNKTVLLIEAGGPQILTGDMPAQSVIGTDLDWNYPIVSQKYAYFGRNGNTCNIPRGRVFGGSSVLNSMNYYRESPEYYSLYESLYGIKNWSFSDVLPYFLKSENNLDLCLVSESNGYNTIGGPLSVSTVEPNIILKRYIKAAQILGYNTTFADGREPFGVTVMQKTIKYGVRQSSATAFLESNSNLNINLHTIGYSLVTKILFNEQKRAIGVVFHNNGAYFTVKARKEVIISAGSIGSPQLLMLSGIGPKEHLQEFNISVISNLKVGESMRNDFAISFDFDIKNQSEVPKPILNVDNEYDFYIKGSGPLAYIASCEHCFRQILFANVSNGCALPRTKFIPPSVCDLDKYVDSFKLKKEWKEYYRPYLNRNKLLLFSLLKRPKSVGTVRLASDNPFDYPVIDPCIFCDNSDLEDLIKTTKLALDVYQSPYFQQFVEIYKNPIPGCYPCPEEYFCDSYIRCVAQTNTDFVVPVGSCRMGSDSDNYSIVDQRLRVKGVTGLRVIDCSVIPIPSEHTFAITIMFAERGAQFIKEDN